MGAKPKVRASLLLQPQHAQTAYVAVDLTGATGGALSRDFAMQLTSPANTVASPSAETVLVRIDTLVHDRLQE